MNEHWEAVKPNHIQMGHASAKHLGWTQLGQCKSAETRSASEATGGFSGTTVAYKGLTWVE